MHKFKVITHYSQDDEDCGGDYESVTIEDERGTVVARYGDYYHDKGCHKAEAFLDGVRFALQEDIEVEEVSINDGEY